MNQASRISYILDRFINEHCVNQSGVSEEVCSLLVHIHEHLFEPDLSVKTAMKRCSLKDNNITSRFRISLGVGMREYIEIMRMRAAKALLKNPDLDMAIIDIAIHLGYEHPQTFYRAFLKRAGCTPASYRQHHTASRCSLAS